MNLELQNIIAEVKINDNNAKENLAKLGGAIEKTQATLGKLTKGTFEYANEQRKLNTLLNLSTQTEQKLIGQIDDYAAKLAKLKSTTAQSTEEQSKLNTEIASTASELNHAKEALKSYFNAGKSPETIGTFQKIGNEISDLTSKQSKLNLETTEGIAEYKAYQKEINELSTKRGKIQNNVAAQPQANSVIGNLFPKLNDIQGKFQQSIGGVGLRLGGAISSFAAPLLALGTLQGIKELGTQAIATAGRFEQLKTTLKTTLGSQSLAESAFKKIQDFAKATPFQVDEITETFIKLANRGINPSTKQLTKIGDLASALGKPLSQVTEAILDINNTERWNELGVKVATNGNKIVGTFKGVTVEADRTEKGALKMVEAFGALKGVAGGMEAQSKTLEGLKSNFQDNIDAMMMNIGDKLLPMAKSYYQTLNSIVGGLAELFAPDYSEKLAEQGKVIQTNNKEVQSAEALTLEYQKLMNEYDGSAEGLQKVSDKALQLSAVLGNSAVVSVGDLRKEMDILSKQTTPKTVEEKKRLVEIETTLSKVLKDTNLSLEEQNKILLANTLGVEENIRQKKLARDKEIVSIVQAQTETQAEITAIEDSQNRIREQKAANSRIVGFKESMGEYEKLAQAERSRQAAGGFGQTSGNLNQESIRQTALRKLRATASSEVVNAIETEILLDKETNKLMNQKIELSEKNGKISKELVNSNLQAKDIASATLNTQVEKLKTDGTEIESKNKMLALDIKTNEVDRLRQVNDRKKAENDLIVNGNLREANSKSLEINEINFKLDLEKSKALKDQSETTQNIVQLETDLVVAKESYDKAQAAGENASSLAQKKAIIANTEALIGREQATKKGIENTYGVAQKDATTGQTSFIGNDSEADREAQAKVKKLLNDQAKAYREYAKELREFNNQVRDSGLDLRQSFNELLPESSLERANATLAIDLEKLKNTYDDKIKGLQDAFIEKGYGKAQREELNKQIANLREQEQNESLAKQIAFNQKLNELNLAQANRLNELKKSELEVSRDAQQKELDILLLSGDERLAIIENIAAKELEISKIDNEKAQGELKSKNEGLKLAVSNAELMLATETNEKKKANLSKFIDETRGLIIANGQELLVIQNQQGNAELKAAEALRIKKNEAQKRGFEEQMAKMANNSESQTTGSNINQLREEIDAVEKNERVKKDIAFKYSQQALAINKEMNLQKRLLLDEQINLVEDRQKEEVALHGKSTDATEKELIELNKIRKTLTKEDLDNTKKSKEEEIAYQREKLKETLDNVKQISDTFLDAAKQIVDAWQQAIDKQITIEESRVARSREIAETGNIAQLEIEKKRLDDLKNERKKAADAQRAITLAQIVLQQILMVANVAATSAQLSPFAVPIAIAGALLAVGAGIASAKAQATAYRKGGKVEGSEQLIRVNEEGQEFVVSAKPTQASPKLLEAINKGKFTDKEFLRLTNLPTMTTQGSVVNNMIDMQKTNDKLDRVVNAIEKIAPNNLIIDVNNNEIIRLYENHAFNKRAIKNR